MLECWLQFVHWQSILQVHRLASLNFSKNFQNCCVIRVFLFSFVVKSICSLRMLCSFPFLVQKLTSVLLSLVLGMLKLELEPCLVRSLTVDDSCFSVFEADGPASPVHANTIGQNTAFSTSVILFSYFF